MSQPWPNPPRPNAMFPVAFLLLVCAIGFWWRLGYLGLIDPDEPFYAESSREMLQADDWVTPRIFGQPQFEKPPLVYWLTMASDRLFGETEFAGRAPAALAATLLVFMVFTFGVRALGTTAGFLGAIVLATGLEFLVTARMILTDMIFVACVSAAAFSLWMTGRSGRWRDAWFVAACGASGLAVLAKGPLGLLFSVFAVLALRSSGTRPWPRTALAGAVGFSAFTVIAAPWYVAMFRTFGWRYFEAFFIHENLGRLLHAEHPSNNRLHYYLLVLVLGSFPWIPALAAPLFGAKRSGDPSGIRRFLTTWGFVCLAFLTVAQSKLPTYALVAFVPLALLTGEALERVVREGAGRAEAWTMRVLGAAQAIPFLLAACLPTFRAFALPFGAVGVCLTAALLLQRRRTWTVWVAITSFGALLLPVGCLTWAGPAADSMLSTRPLMGAIVLATHTSEEVFASPQLARGVFYYTRRPVRVLSNRPNPFYSPHPLPIVVSRDFDDYMDRRGSVLCVALTSDWARFRSSLRKHRWSVVDSVGMRVAARATGATAGESPAPPGVLGGR